MKSSNTFKTIRPFVANAIHGIVFKDNFLLAIDSASGYLLKVDPQTNNTSILNPNSCDKFIDTTGIAYDNELLWYTNGNSVYFYSLNQLNFQPSLFVSLNYPANGIAIWESTVYVTCQKTGYIYVFEKKTAREITRFRVPGIGIENITVREEELWLTDTLEQTVYCLERATGQIIFSVLTPFQSPSGLAFSLNSETDEEILYVSYSFSEPYVRDNPNIDPNFELSYRTNTFIHPLYFKYNVEAKYAISNGFLVEMCYTEELEPLDPFELGQVEWHIALPAQTDRQKIVEVEYIGIPFTEEIKKGQRIAVFKFDQLTEKSRFIFGWRALLEVWSIKYAITPKECEKLPIISTEYREGYLADNDNLSMDSEIIKKAAIQSIGNETNFLRKIHSIRNYVYDCLSYEIKPHIDTPEIALTRGLGSCGEYLGVLLALSRLNNIACRTVGRYKCPQYPFLKNIPLEPQYNHVWMEFFLPNYGWLPMESNPDDIEDGGPYPNRFFMGLAWYHAEMAKDVPFERLFSKGLPVDKTAISIGNLALNHVQFTILKELKP
jgi:transglutaminase-like putative cysteine protease